MSMKLDARLASTGTRFRLFAQPRFIEGFDTPEIVYINVLPSLMQPGPADDRAYVIDALNKLPYDDFTRPPYSGARNPPVQPGPDGHYDHIALTSREFSCATMYATVRRVLDIWEDFFGRKITLLGPGKLELIPLIEWDNAQSGIGFLEFGFGRQPLGGIDRNRPYCENFDVLAHELGHNIIFAEIGFPTSDVSSTNDFWGFHESAGDLVAIVSSLHFNSVVDHLLTHTHGNLFTPNELSRVGELSESRQIRIAFNDQRYSPLVTEAHDLSVPLTGAIFDILVDVFQRRLVEGGYITQQLATLSNHVPGGTHDEALVKQQFETAHAANVAGFRLCLLEARDYLGRLLATTWDHLSPEFLTYNKVYRELLRSDIDVSGGKYQNAIRDCFAWRQIPLSPVSGLRTIRQLRQCGLLDEADEMVAARVEPADQVVVQLPEPPRRARRRR
jgi:hypothetical protein